MQFSIIEKERPINETERPKRRAPTLLEGQIESYFNLKYNDVKAYYSETLSDTAVKEAFDFNTIIEKIKSLMEKKPKEVNRLIGHTLFTYLESKYDSLETVDRTARNCIIPVGLPGSGKSYLMKDLQSTYVICDADDIRDLIINAFLTRYFDTTEKIPSEKEAITMKRENNEKFKKWVTVYPSLIPLFKKYILFGDKSDTLTSSIGCSKGIESYCPPLINYKDDKSEVIPLPQAFDIFLLYCKEKSLNFIYDATNTEPTFRYSIMLRCYLMGGYKKFEIRLLITPLSNVYINIAERNKKTVRMTKEEFADSKLLSFFDMDPQILASIDTYLNDIMEQITKLETDIKSKEALKEADIKSKEALFNANKEQTIPIESDKIQQISDKIQQIEAQIKSAKKSIKDQTAKAIAYLKELRHEEYEKLLIDTINKIYDERSLYYGLSKDDFTRKFPYINGKDFFTLTQKIYATRYVIQEVNQAATGGSIFYRTKRRSRRTRRSRRSKRTRRRN